MLITQKKDELVAFFDRNQAQIKTGIDKKSLLKINID